MVDLEHEGHRGSVGAVQRFPTEVALSEYTIEMRKIYPRARVPKKSLLEFLLRHILNPRPRRRERVVRGHKKKSRKQKGVESIQSEKRCG